MHARFCHLILALCLLSLVGQSARAANVVEARAALYAEYAKKLAELATWCDEQNIPDAAAELQAWLPNRAADRLTLFVLPSMVEKPTAVDPQPPEWRSRWQALRATQAEALFALARRAVSEHRSSIAYELVSEAVRENSDHVPARRMLGYVKYRDRWATPFEIRQLGAGKTWHDRFGWLPKGHVDRYEKGQRYYQGRWLAAADESVLRGDLKRGWRVESEHYVVTTNHSLEEGVRLSRELEHLYAIWQQVFVPYLYSESELARRFEGRAPRREPKQHDVVCFRDRREYQNALRSAQPQIDITLGIYFDNTQTAYFFAGEEQEPGTLYHEATHQLFQEIRSVAAEVARRDNFWIVEGIACYMESLAAEQGYYTLGGTNAGRMPAARHRLLEDQFYVPLGQLVTIGMESLQRDPQITKLYSECSGLSDFLMHDGQGRYRDALCEYLSAVYSGRADGGTLAHFAHSNYDELDRQYRQFMSAGETVPTGSSQ